MIDGPRGTGPWSDLGRPPLRTAALRSALLAPGGAFGRLDVLAEVPSTHAHLVDAVRADPGAWPDLAVVTTDSQTAGRGRLGRSFPTPPRAALTTSVLLRTPVGSGPRATWLPLLTGLAMVRALRRHAGVQAVLKWPNDVLVPDDDAAEDAPLSGHGKVCGVLAEMVRPATADAGPVVVVGAGLNVSQSRAELPVPTATSLRLVGAATTDRDPLLRAWLRELASAYRRWRDGDPGLAVAVREVCATLGQQVRVELPGGGSLDGVAEGLDDDGALLVRAGDGAGGALHAVSAGDVVHLRTR